MKTFLKRIFTNPFRQSASHGINKPQAVQKQSVVQIQRALRSAVHDCTDVRGQRVQYKIDNSKTPAELWALRSDLHQCIAQIHSERVATVRINDMTSIFEGWIPASQLTKIEPGFRHSAK